MLKYSQRFFTKTQAFRKPGKGTRPASRGRLLFLALVLTAALPANGQTPPSKPARESKPDDYRRHALTKEGDIERGKALFFDEGKFACSKCHSVDGTAGKAGPDLFAAGDKFTRRDLIDSILTPSASIAVGYVTSVVETKSGERYQGIIKETSDSGLQLIGADAKVVHIPKGQIESRTGSSISLMPEGLQAGSSTQDFTDLIEYLTSLKQPENSLNSNRGMPAIIPELSKPVGLEPFFKQQLRAPSTVQVGLTGFLQIPGSSNRFLVLHQTGIIWLMEKNGDQEEKTIFSNLTNEVFHLRGPNGLLGLAFHPKFLSNRKYYLRYQVFEEGTVATVLVEKLFAENFKSDSGKPPRRLLKINSVAEDHGGGNILFGPDGYLYFGMGDTGPHHDPNGHGQNLKLLMGKILRLDVDRRENGLEYGIPSDNPFRNNPEARPEIWAYGLRQPWQNTFDPVTGDLWVGDVGQDRVDEIDIVRSGENHGWNVYEGFEPFSNKYRKEGANYVPPVFAYKRKYGISVTGGFVYRGDKGSSFYGVYVFGDYSSKRIFGLTQENRTLKNVRQIGTSPQEIVAFSTDDSGNLYLVGFQGMVYRMDFRQANFEEVFSRR